MPKYVKREPAGLALDQSYSMVTEEVPSERRLLAKEAMLRDPESTKTGGEKPGEKSCQL